MPTFSRKDGGVSVANMTPIDTSGLQVRQVGNALTVATLPTGVAAGTRAFVTDANSTTFNAVAAGGGTNKVPVNWDGAAWHIG